MIYECLKCQFFTDNKSKFRRHLNTQKHMMNSFDSSSCPSNSLKIPQKTSFFLKKPQFSSKNLNFPHKSGKLNENESNFSDFETENNESSDTSTPENPPNDTIECEYCFKAFSRIDNLNRHIKDSCKEKKKLDQEREEELKRLEEYKKREREIYNEHIDKLLDRVGNTNITHNTLNNNSNTNNSTNNNNCEMNRNNNIQLNNFGEENKEMLTNKFMTNMIKYPYTAIPKMIEKIHFNDNYPENKNIRMLNKRDNKLQVQNNTRWDYVHKNETIRNLIDEQNYTMDKFFTDNKDTFSELHQKRYNGFQKKMDNDDSKTVKNIKNDTELVFWNNMV